MICVHVRAVVNLENCMSHSWIISNIFRLPYDWRNPFGYMFAVAYQLITFLGVLEIFVTCLVIYLGVCKFSIAFADDFVANFGEISHKIGECNGNFTSKKQTILNQQLTEIMDFQVNAVQLSVHFENIKNQTLLISSFFFTSRLVTQFAKLYKKFISMIFFVITVYLCLFLLRFQVVSQGCQF